MSVVESGKASRFVKQGRITKIHRGSLPKKMSLFSLVWVIVVSSCGIPGASITTGDPATSATPISTSFPVSGIVTQTATPLSTLRPEVADREIRSMLLDSNACAAPCFWGIVPGQTTESEVIDLFARFGIQVEMKPAQVTEREVGFAEYRLMDGYTLHFRLWFDDSVVNDIELAFTPEIFEPDVQSTWSAYSIDNLLKRIGSPSSVDIQIGEGEGGVYALTVYFISHNLIARYSGYALNSEICPHANNISFVELFFGPTPVDPPPLGVQLEDATDLSMDDFYQLMTSDPVKACLPINDAMYQ